MKKIIIFTLLGFLTLGISSCSHETNQIETNDQSSTQIDIVTNNQTTDTDDQSTGDNQPSNIEEFSITGVNYMFTINGEENPEIRVDQGDTVRITFTSDEGFHDWMVDELSGASTTRVSTGESTTIEFVADQIGEFEYYCSVGSHRANGMKGMFIVK